MTETTQPADPTESTQPADPTESTQPADPTESTQPQHDPTHISCEEFTEKVNDLAGRLIEMCREDAKKNSNCAISLIALLTAAEAAFCKVAEMEEYEIEKYGIEDTNQKELTGIIAKWCLKFADAIVAGKEAYHRSKKNEDAADAVTPTPG